MLFTWSSRQTDDGKYDLGLNITNQTQLRDIYSITNFTSWGQCLLSAIQSLDLTIRQFSPMKYHQLFRLILIIFDKTEYL